MLGIIRSESVSMPMILQLLHNRNRLSFFSTIDIPTACMWAEQGLYLAQLVRQQTTEKKPLNKSRQSEPIRHSTAREKIA